MGGIQVAMNGAKGTWTLPQAESSELLDVQLAFVHVGGGRARLLLDRRHAAGEHPSDG